MFQAETSTSSCDLEVKLRNQLSRLLSPEFNVTIDDVAEIMNILNVIKTNCAHLPEKFRLLVGLLCQVDLSITSIEEHYEQLLIKNRIFHLLRMFPEVAHPLLDAIARATNYCCPLSSLPVTIGKIEEERAFLKQGYSSGRNPVWNHNPCLQLSSTRSNYPITAVAAGTRHTGSPSGETSSSTANSSSPHQMLTLRPNPKLPLAGSNQPAEFDLSRRMYDQAPSSFRQCSVQRVGGAFNPSRARESPSDIQKRILLQQQRHLLQQLEILQAQRLQQTSCIKNLTYEQLGTTRTPAIPSSSTLSKPPSGIMESSLSVRSAVIGPSANSSQPMRITRSCSQINQPTVKKVVKSNQSSSNIQAVDLRSPERLMRVFRKTIVEPSGKTENHESKKLSVEMKNSDTDERPVDKAERDNTDDKTEGLLLSQVGQHCIMVSVLDGSTSGSKTQDCTAPEADTVPKTNKSNSVSSKSRTKQKPKRGKAGQGSCKGTVINVKELCRVHTTRQSSSYKTPSSNIPPNHRQTAVITSHGATHRVGQGQQDLITNEDRSHQDKSHPNQVNCNNNNCDGIYDEQNSSTKLGSSHESKLGKKKRQMRPVDDGKMQDFLTNESQHASGNLANQLVGKQSDETLDPSMKPLDLSLTRTPVNNAGNKTGKADTTDAAFEPLTGALRRKQDQRKAAKPFRLTAKPQRQLSHNAQSIHDANIAYLLCRYGIECDDEALCQSSQSEATLPNQTPTSTGGKQSNIPIRSSSSVGLDTFSGRLVQNGCKSSPVVDANNAKSRPTGVAVAAKRKCPQAKSSKDKKRKR